MRKTRTKVSRETKEQILSESLQAGCDIELLAKRYKLSSTTIHKWRISYNKQSQTQVYADVAACQFIEVKQLPIKKRETLKKVELLFDNYSCCIEDKMSSNQLVKLVQLLEEGSC